MDIHDIHFLSEEISDSDVPVAGFDLKSTLNPALWEKNDSLRPQVRRRLLEIVGNFIKSLTVQVDVHDVHITGSLANYNWSKYSDVDLHIVVDFYQLDDDEDLVRGYFNYKRGLWNLRHDITIEGYEVEIYVENIGDVHSDRDRGVYSITREEWLSIPSPEQLFKINVPLVKKKAASIMNQIEIAEDIFNDSDEEALSLGEIISDRIGRMRQIGLESESGPYSAENIAFKVLRRTEYLKRLSDLKLKAYDSMMSLE